MKPVLRQIVVNPSRSFLIRTDIGADMINNWHYHPEIEILYLKNSAGTWLIGDHIGHYQPGDIIVIGANLPHSFQHEEQYVQPGQRPEGEAICIKFIPELLGSHFLNLPEATQIRELLQKCGRGLQLGGKIRDLVGESMRAMLTMEPGKKLVALISILEEIADSKGYSLLSSIGFTQLREVADNDRIKGVFDYTLKNFGERITIDDVAALLNMTRQSFCRYFKSRTNKTYIQFLTEVRIGSACRLLVEDEKNVAEVSYECGYNNISHFNHQFKSVTGKKPLEYKKDYLSTEG